MRIVDEIYTSQPDEDIKGNLIEINIVDIREIRP